MDKETPLQRNVQSEGASHDTVSAGLVQHGRHCIAHTVIIAVIYPCFNVVFSNTTVKLCLIGYQVDESQFTSPLPAAAYVNCALFGVTNSTAANMDVCLISLDIDRLIGPKAFLRLFTPPYSLP